MSSMDGGRGIRRGSGRGRGITRTSSPSIDVQRETEHIPPPNIPISAPGVGTSSCSISRPCGHDSSSSHPQSEEAGHSVPDTEAPFDRRIYICPTVDKDFGPVDHNRAAVKKIGEIISGKYTGAASTYTELEDNVKEMWFGEFKRCFRWNVQDERKIKDIFSTRIGRAFSQKMYNVRKKAKKPNYMNDDAHNTLKDYWSSEEFLEKSRKAKQNRAADASGSISHFSGAKNRMRREEDLRKELERPPRQDEIFFAQYAKKNENGEVQQWANRKAENAYTGYMESISSQASNSQEGNVPSWPPHEDQLKIWAEIQGVSKKGTVYGLSRQASQVCPTRSARTSGTPAADSGQISEILTELASVKDSMETLKENHKAELEMQRETYLKEMEMQSTRQREEMEMQSTRQRETYLKEMEMQRMMFANFLATTVQSQGGTSQSSQPIVSQHQAGTSQSGMIYSHFPGMLAPNTFPMFFNVPPAADPQPSQAPSQSQPPPQQGHGNDTFVPETQDN